MMEERFLIIDGTLPGLNEYIDAARANRYKAANMKRRADKKVIEACHKYLKGVVFDKPVFIEFAWVEPNRRRDKDNIAFAKKFLMDGLVKAGVIKNDGWDEVDGFLDIFDIDAKNPRIIVFIKEVNKK